MVIAGGGVFIQIGSQDYLVGINSFINSWPLNATCGYNTVSAATAVSPWNSWIQNNTVTLADTLTWRNYSFGSFHDWGDWNSQLFEYASPASADTIRFVNIGSDCEVYFERDGFSKKIQLETGNLTLDLGGNTYTVGESVEIGYSTSALGHNLTVHDGKTNRVTNLDWKGWHIEHREW